MFNSKEKGFSLIELIIVLIITAILAQLGFVSFNRYTRRTRAFAAKTALKNIQKECDANTALNASDQFTALPINGYSLDSGVNNNCAGNSDGFIVANPLKNDYLPIWRLNPRKGTITCSYDSTKNSFFIECKREGKLERFKNQISKAYEEGKLLENKFYERGNSRYVIVEGDTWEAAQANAVSLGGNLATINDKEENDYLIRELYGSNKVSDKLEKKFRISGEPLRGTSIWLGHADQNLEGKYTSVSGEKNIYSNWGPGELADGIGKKEKYTMFTLFDTYNRDPGMIGTVYNRQYNTQALRDRGGAHVFYGLAEIKIDE